MSVSTDLGPFWPIKEQNLIFGLLTLSKSQSRGALVKSKRIFAVKRRNCCPMTCVRSFQHQNYKWGFKATSRHEHFQGNFKASQGHVVSDIYWHISCPFNPIITDQVEPVIENPFDFLRMFKQGSALGWVFSGFFHPNPKPRVLGSVLGRKFLTLGLKPVVGRWNISQREANVQYRTFRQYSTIVGYG